MYIYICIYIVAIAVNVHDILASHLHRGAQGSICVLLFYALVAAAVSVRGRGSDNSCIRCGL